MSTHRPGETQRAILEAMKNGGALRRLPKGVWRLNGKPVSRDACMGLYVYGYIMSGFDYELYILTARGKTAIAPREGENHVTNT